MGIGDVIKSLRENAPVPAKPDKELN